MKAVHFGAGAIGRGFIAELLHRSGYEVTFVDVNEAVIDAIDAAGVYDIYWIEEGMRRQRIDGVRGIRSADQESVLQALVEADLVTTSVWANNLHRLAPVIGRALERRAEQGRPALQFIPCENAIDNGQILADAVAEVLPERDQAWLAGQAGFASTVVDRMVFDAPDREGVAPVEVGVDFELAIDRTALVDPTQTTIEGAHYVDELGPYLERKLFVINGGHARAAYLGAVKGYTVMTQVYADEALNRHMRESMLQAAAVMAHDHDFDTGELEGYVDFTIRRWQTPGVVDEISRVGRSPIGKIGADERLVAPALRAAELGLPNDLLLDGIAAALLYRDEHDAEAAELAACVTNEGPEIALKRYCAIDPTSPAGADILARYTALKTKEDA